jgi:diketogulonate reductase-like aldo/keto reductase
MHRADPPPTTATPTVATPDGAHCPALGLGTWRYGEDAALRAAEVHAIRAALDIGCRVIDTAEMYADGGAESIVGEALAQALRGAGAVARDDLVVVSKVYPHHASRREMRSACTASLRRLRLDHLDLYLLHWRGTVPLAETVEAFEDLVARGLIRRWGVSNFDVDDLSEISSLPGGSACAANQVYLSLTQRGPEFALLPWQQARSMPLMAYSPLDQGALARHPALRRIAHRHAATPTQVALAALLAKPGVMVIPKSSDPDRIRENWGARRLRLDAQDHADLDKAFPAPQRKHPLAML